MLRFRNMRVRLTWAVALTAGALCAQRAPIPWRDPSPHKVLFTTAAPDVKLETLDWGGSGPPLVLLTGLGNNAHVFDDFAPKLTDSFHVYAITRRGYGASTAPMTGYDADRLADDVLAVLAELKVDRPIVAGHSIAGEELSSIGSRHPERVAGLVYLDAHYTYAWFDPDSSDPDPGHDLNEIRRKLDVARSLSTGSKKAMADLLNEELPRLERDLRQIEAIIPDNPPPPPKPPAIDRSTFAAFAESRRKASGLFIPEAELRNSFEATPEGGVGAPRTTRATGEAIVSGTRRYTKIGAPALFIAALPHRLPPDLDPAQKPAIELLERSSANQLRSIEAGVPGVQILRIRDADHYVFISHEEQVLKSIREFAARLK